MSFIFIVIGFFFSSSVVAFPLSFGITILYLLKLWWYYGYTLHNADSKTSKKRVMNGSNDISLRNQSNWFYSLSLFVCHTCSLRSLFACIFDQVPLWICCLPQCDALEQYTNIVRSVAFYFNTIYLVWIQNWNLIKFIFRIIFSFFFIHNSNGKQYVR